MASRLTLRIGHRGTEVAKLQRNLKVLGHLISDSGTYDQSTANAIMSFQRNNGLDATGEATVKTQEALESIISPSDMPSVSISPVSSNPGQRLGIPVAPSVVPAISSLHVIVISSDESSDELARCLAKVNEVLRSKSWGLVIALSNQGYLGMIKTMPLGCRCLEVIRYSGSWVNGLNQATVYCRKLVQHFQTVYPIRACDFPLPGLVSRVWPIMVANDYACAYGDWIQDHEQGTINPATLDSPLIETVVIGSVLFSTDLIPIVEAPLFSPVLSSHADVSTWMHWKFAEVRMVPVQGAVCCVITRRPDGDDVLEWMVMRDRLYRSIWSRPKVSALMITGRCMERYPSARVGVQCFLDQTWPNKELVIINHGDDDVFKGNDPRIREFRVTKSQGTTLGDLRNWSIEESKGDWCVQWDDDDWHHPTRIENQVGSSKETHLTTYIWQVRCALTDGSAFYDRLDVGQQMSILFHRGTSIRYERLEAREDTAFIKSFSDRCIRIDNSIHNLACDPLQYVRFFHGRNIWDYNHVMRGSSGVNRPKPGIIDLSPYHQVQLDRIKRTYDSQPGFSISMEPVEPPALPS